MPAPNGAGIFTVTHNYLVSKVGHLMYTALDTTQTRVISANS
jgi:hypothetical protein